MSIAAIIFNRRTHPVTLDSLKREVERIGFPCRIGEWRYLTSVVPQLEIATDPAIALQLNDDEAVQEETAELVEDGSIEVAPEDENRLRACNACIEVVSGQQPVFHKLPGGGLLSYTEGADIASPATQQPLDELALRLDGFLWVNV